MSKYIVTKITPIVEDDFIKYYVIKNKESPWTGCEMTVILKREKKVEI